MPKVDKLYGSCAEHAGVTAQGYLRDAQAYWMAVYNRCPKAFSEANLTKMFNPIRKVIKNNNFHSPLNDKTFRNSFPQYDIPGKRNDVLHHHHVGGRGQAIPVPSSLHKGSGEIHRDEKIMVYYTKEEEIDMSNLKEIIIKYIKKLTNIHTERTGSIVDFGREKK